MELSALFFINSLLLGVGLSMDAFSVSLINGLNHPAMEIKKASAIAFMFAFFQAAMPLLGWVLTHTMMNYFTFLKKIVPYISLILLIIIGLKMLFGGPSQEDTPTENLTFLALLLQGIATSLDALSVGFTIADYGPFAAVLASLIIASVTYVICFIGVQLGKQAGCRFSGRAEVLGGIVLIGIGIEIFLTHGI